LFFFSSRRRHTRSKRDWSSDVCSSDLENIDKRISELKSWENSLIFNNKMEIQKQRLMLSKISSERDMLTKANEILDKQAERFFRSEERRVGKEYRNRW